MEKYQEGYKYAGEIVDNVRETVTEYFSLLGLKFDELKEFQQGVWDRITDEFQ